MNRKVLMCGSRDWVNVEVIRAWIAKLQDFGYDTLIEGEAKGADSIARDEAEKAGMIILESSSGVKGFPANWDKFHKAAGAIRNTQMLKEGKPDLVVAFHNNINESKGTKNMVTQATKANIKVIVVKENE